VSRLDAVRARASLYAKIRSFFQARGYCEVETPLCVPSPGLEVHLDAVRTASGLYLITSPEYHMKRLLAAGLPRIYQLAKCFRAGERGPWHHPEFTMLEWYRTGADYLDLLAETEELLRASAGAEIFHRGERIDLSAPFERLTTQEALWRHAGIDWRAHPEPDDLRRAAERAGFGSIPAGDTWDDTFHRVFLTAVEPKLGRGRPTALLDYPARMSALARLKPSDPGVAERFEIYVAGVELCNAFSELTDPAEQRRRFEADQAERRRLGRPIYPIDEKLLAALGALPPCAGIALGIDRWLLLLCDANDLDEVLFFGGDRL
jgi:lysyl-tRNA synthetase class 2